MLNDGKSGLQAFYAEAKRMGLVLSAEAIGKGTHLAISSNKLVSKSKA